MRKTHQLEVAGILLASSIITACGQKETPPPAPPPAVEYQSVELQPVATALEFVARTRAREDAGIRSRITGTIIERPFDEGQLVEENSLLFKIDPRPYEAALQSARASLADALASLDVGRKNLKRAEELQPDGFISDMEVDEIKGQVNQALAAQASAQAAIERAELDLEFTDIRAPFTGTTGRTEFSIGDLVNPVSGVLVTLVKRDPMLADFDVDERSLAEALKVNQERARQGLDPIHYQPRLKLVSGDFYAHDGEIDYANNRVNASTGTVAVTARFPNPDGVLLPGQFARIVVQRGELEMQLLIPQPSVLEDMQGSYVFALDESDSIQRKNVTLGQRHKAMRVVETGLEEGDRVIVNGIQKVRPGMTVNASPVEALPYDAPESSD